MIFDLELKPATSIALKDDSGHSITYGDLVETVTSNKTILQKRNLVFVLAENTVSVVSFLITCFEKKLIPLVLNKDLDCSLLLNYIYTYKPNAIFSPSELVLDDSLDVKRVISWDDYKIQILSTVDISVWEQLSFLLPTSGSTGSPKLVRHSYENIQFSAQSVAQFFEINSNDNGLGILPIYYTMGFSVITSHLYAGACIRLTQYSLTERGFWDILKNEGITILTGVPYTFEVLYKMRFDRVKIPSLRILTQGGGKLSDVMWDSLVQYAVTNQIKFVPTYGQTEGTARMSFLDSSKVIEKKGSIGKPIPGGTFEVWNDAGEAISTNPASGELVYKGKNVTMGYAESIEDLNLGDLRGGILRTGDIVQRDSEGYYFIIGRQKRFLKIFGLRISLDEVELLVKNNFSVDCYTSGNDEILLVYITNEAIRVEVKEWLANKIGLFHQAIDIQFIENIPRSSSGKVIFNT